MSDESNGNDRSDQDNEIPFSEEWERVTGSRDKKIGPDTIIDTLPPPDQTPPQNEDKE
jgi:hypothetical protein